jgi:hypothetical protein
MKNYRKKGLQRMFKWTPRTLNMEGISISQADLDAGSPKEGDMIAVSATNPKDKWLLAFKFFTENYEPE